jgi:hypothetical protein
MTKISCCLFVLSLKVFHSFFFVVIFKTKNDLKFKKKVENLNFRKKRGKFWEQ